MAPTNVPERPLKPVERGEAGRVLRELRAQDFVFTVLDTHSVTPGYHRIRCAGNGFLRTHTPYPTMWVRLWFFDPADATSGHQRAYTLIDPDVTNDTFTLEFAIHDGAAARWAQQARPGDQIEASLYGSEPTLPRHDDVDRHLLVGDPASLPAVNSLLDALSPAPTTVLLEWVRDDDRTLPVRLRDGDTLRWIERVDDGVGMVRAVEEELSVLLAAYAPERLFAWGACDTVTTRSLTKRLRGSDIPRESVKTLGYWLPSGVAN